MWRGRAQVRAGIGEKLRGLALLVGQKTCARLARARMALTIDRRERSLIQLLPEASIETLDVGDVWCRLGDGVISFVVERKRVDDFAASIIDGRWSEGQTCKK